MTASDTVPATDTLVAKLRQCRDLVVTATKAVAPRLPAPLRPVVEYHMGWSDINGQPISGDAGKLLRGCLAVLSAEVVGRPAVVGVPAAVALELVHNFSLMHDDVIDLDRERRHRPTAWTVFGVGTAVLTGDALLATALEVLLDDAERGADAAAALLRATALMIDGQARDMTFQAHQGRTVDDVLEMFSLKTGALFGAAASLGALLAGAEPAVVTALRQYGTNLGVAFQVIDDLLGILGDPAVTGKDVGGDVRRRKLTLPLAAALASDRPEADELHAIMKGSGELDSRHVNRAVQLIEACGGREFAEQCAAQHHDAAIKMLESVPATAAPAAWESLNQIALFSIERQH
jgi:geranylgeranyl diphosphate synthase type I